MGWPGQVLEVARLIQSESQRHVTPPEEGFPSASQMVVPISVVRGSRTYIETVTNQINGCYERGWYDACGVLTRRLVESLLIEVFEHKGIASKIQNSAGDYKMLGDIIEAALKETSFGLSRETKSALPKIKKSGDRSAHNRRYLSHRKDFDKIIDGIRVVVQDLILLAQLK